MGTVQGGAGRELLDQWGAELEALVAAGERADNEAIDLYAFTSVLKRHLDAMRARRSSA